MGTRHDRLEDEPQIEALTAACLRKIVEWSEAVDTAGEVRMTSDIDGKSDAWTVAEAWMRTAWDLAALGNPPVADVLRRANEISTGVQGEFTFTA
jgi:hypothetical protein